MIDWNKINYMGVCFMALINCPECAKEISDKVLACPNCGFPMSESTNQMQKVELSSVKLKLDKKKKNKILLSVFIIFSLLIVSTIVYSANERANIQKYNENVDLIKNEMLTSATLAETLMNLTSRVWSDAIYERFSSDTYFWTINEYHRYNDFDTALQKMFEDGTVKKNVRTISESQERVILMMKDLNNPPKSYEKVHEAMLELHAAYQSATDLAINPQGNLNSFSENSTEKINKFIELYKKIDTIIPET